MFRAVPPAPSGAAASEPVVDINDGFATARSASQGLVSGGCKFDNRGDENLTVGSAVAAG
jgi:hypothetical protein